MPQAYIPYSDPYTTPEGFNQTRTPQGGTAYSDKENNTYVRDAGGFKLFSPTPSPSIAPPSPAVLTAAPARDAVVKSQTQLQQELERIKQSALTLQDTVSKKAETEKNQPAPASPTPTTAQESTQEDQPSDLESQYQQTLNEFKVRQAEVDKQFQADQQRLTEIGRNLDVANQNLIKSIQSSYTRALAEADRVNQATLAGLTQAGIRAGRNRYAPELEQQALTNEMNAGIQRIADLEAERDGLIAQAQIANSKEQFDELYKTMGLVQKATEDRNKSILDFYQKAIDLEKTTRESAKAKLENIKLQGEIENTTIDSLTNLLSLSLTGDKQKDLLIAQGYGIQYGVDPNKLYSAALDLQNKYAGGDLGLYQAYVDQERRSGRAPDDIETFLDRRDLARAAANPSSYEVSTDPFTGQKTVINKVPGAGTPAQRNNNPGNLKDPKTGQFRVFDSQQEGFEELLTDLAIKVSGASSTGLTPQSTLLDFAKTYAPESDNNNPKGYAEFLAKKLNVSVTTKIGTLAPRLTELALAITEMEDRDNYQANGNGAAFVYNQVQQNPAIYDSLPPELQKALVQYATNNSLQLPAGVKGLSGEASKIKSIAETMVPEINSLKTAFRNDYKGALRGIVLGTDRKLVKLVDNIADKVGRLRSGGAINKDEETRFKRQIASFMDIPFGNEDDAIAALDGILAEANTVSGGISPNSNNDLSELEDDIQDTRVVSRYSTREKLIEALVSAYPELDKDQIASKVYTLIPDKK